MRDKFLFSDAQDLSALDSTGEISDSIWDLEEDGVTDDQVMGWINILVTAADATLAGDEGVWIEVRTEDETNLNWDSATAGQIGSDSDQHCLGAILLRADELVAGAAFSFGICKAKLGKYLGLWYRAASTSVNDTLNVDAWFSEQPISVTGIQKRPS